MAFVPGVNWGVEDGVFCASFGDQVEQDSPGGVVLQASYSSVRGTDIFSNPSDLFAEAVRLDRLNKLDGPGTQWEICRIAYYSQDGDAGEPNSLDLSQLSGS